MSADNLRKAYATHPISAVQSENSSTAFKNARFYLLSRAWCRVRTLLANRPSDSNGRDKGAGVPTEQDARASMPHSKVKFGAMQMIMELESISNELSVKPGKLP